MTLNVRRPVPHLRRTHPDRWEVRKPVLGALLESERPTVLGVQEAMPEQGAFVADVLGHGYRSALVGRGRRGDGEACGILVDSERLELVEERRWALSSTPDVPGSRSWGNALPRIAVGAVLRDRHVGSRFLVVVTHLDHLSARSRLASARMLRSIVVDFDGPAIVMGDGNTDVGTPPYRELVSHPGRLPQGAAAAAPLVDTWDVAAERVGERWGTYSRYRAPVRGGRRIDWLLATPDWRVARVGVNPFRRGGLAPSDHDAVQAVLRPPVPDAGSAYAP